MRTDPMLLFKFSLSVFVGLATIKSSIAQQDVLADYRISILSDDVQLHNPVNRCVHLMITNVISCSNIELLCQHRTLGGGDWQLEYVSIQTGNQITNKENIAIAQLIADTTRITEDMLIRKYPPDRVSSIVLREEKMPEHFTQQIYRLVTSEMNKSNARAEPAYDRHLKHMLQIAFDKNECIQLLGKKLQERGFAFTHAQPPELVAVRRNLAGMTWREILKEETAGLQVGSATVIYYDLRQKTR